MVQTVRALIEISRTSEDTMITSVGTLPYELALVQALKLGIPVKVCVTSSALERNADTLDSFRNKLAREFMINGAPLEVTLIPTRELDERDSQRLRDEFVLKNSNKIFLISIRQGERSKRYLIRVNKSFIVLTIHFGFHMILQDKE